MVQPVIFTMILKSNQGFKNVKIDNICLKYAY